ncbi:MAG: heme exporter protein CcmB [Sphingomonadaceae bacterium]|uniref:heme exporter protein CcmB n=1 Tax=Thermaurantiacus sp. TaxID=2820283 RepID=UPI00298F2B6F|nr:heme exporter protein CcmB [Thermaurantiacus sp.]MCS6986489.1 heme exporter protein CcmB [Sphingomonadaceae bacterium]MDW8414250.1 heme exporter protein CcmB [Thermaurantiacus sp.]
MTMARVVAHLVARDLTQAVARPADLLLPPAFLVVVAVTFALALGAEAARLAPAAPAALWVGAFLAALLPVPGLWAADLADGTLDQLAVRGIPAETVAAARLVATILLLGVPLLMALAPAGLLLGLAPRQLVSLALSLLLGVPGLAALAVLMGALVAGARGGAGLVAVLLVPIAIPLLVFGAGFAAPGAPRLMGGTTLLLVALCPFATAMALRLGREA